MKPRSQVSRRGQPLLALVLLMVSWVGARAALWEAPEIKPAGRIEAAIAAKAHPAAAKRDIQPSESRSSASDRSSAGRKITPPPAVLPRPSDPTLEQPGAPSAASDSPADATQLRPGAPVAQRDPLKVQPETVEVARDQQLLYSDAMAIPMTEDSEAVDVPGPRGAAAVVSAAAAPIAARGPSHWSGDAWLLLRQGGNAFNAPGAGLPGVVVPVGFYGGSQTGAVLRYRLDPASGRRPALYLRFSSGLEWPRGEELAGGFMFRPLARVPVSVMLEGRATHTISGTVVRPAAAVVTELPPARLPLGLRGEAYVQAGVVGGRQGTGFVDGQARIDRPFIKTGKFQLSAGGGAWGGAQKGASRLDVGPSAALAVPIGPAGARISADYRIRVAGRAAPGSGAVLTLSAGF